MYSHFFESYGKEGNTKYKVDSASDCPMLAGQGFLKFPAKAKDELLSQNPSRHAPILCRVGCMGKVSTWCFLTTCLKYYGFNTCTIPDIGNLKLLQSSYASMQDSTEISTEDVHIQQEYGTDPASPRAGSLLGLPHTEVEQGCCCHPQEVQPSPSTPPVYPPCRASTEVPACRHTFLLLPAAVATLPLGTFKEFGCALLSHSVGLPYPWCEPQCNSHQK